MADNEIDFDIEYFQRATLRKAEKKAMKDVNNEFGSDEDISEPQRDGFYETRRQYHYIQLMKQASVDANSGIPIHIETSKTADEKAIRYKLKKGFDEVDLSTDNAVDNYFDTIQTTVSEAKKMEQNGYFRTPSEAIAFSKGGSISAKRLVKIMNEKNISISDLAEILGKKTSTVESWMESGVPKTMADKVNDLIG